MVGFIFGTVCLVALFAQLARSRYRWHSYAGMHDGPYMGRSHRVWRYGCSGYGVGSARLREHVLFGLFERLSTTREQEEVLSEAARAVEARLRASRAELADLRPQLAALLKQDTFDRAAASMLASRAQPALDGARDALLDACGRVHAALEPDQRRQLARLLEGGRFGGGR